MASGSRWITVALLAAGAAGGCGGEQPSPKEIADASLDGGGGGDDGSLFLPESGCDAGWECHVDTSCSTPTTLSGKVFDPSGATPLPNIVVYVPREIELPTITRGSASCNLVVADYVTATLSRDDGTFTLKGVPTGKSVPVVVQAGKWRRMVYVDASHDCEDNPVADGVLRLPRRRSEGEMPQMALLTGGEDNLGCLLLRAGVDLSELTAPGTGGRVDVYRGVGGADVVDVSGAQSVSVTEGDCTGPSCPLWASVASLAAYDVVLLGCEGSANLQTKPASALQAMHDWLRSGGRLFGVHSQDVWLASGPPDFQSFATWIDGGASGAPGPFQIDTTFPNGNNFEAWAEAIGATDAGGRLQVASGDVATSVAAVQSPAVAWIHDESTAAGTSAGAVKALSVLVLQPSDAGEISGCTGVAILTDIHPEGTVPLTPIPGACPTGPLTAEEKVLEYLFFHSMEPTPVGCGDCPLPPPPPPDDAGP